MQCLFVKYVSETLLTVNEFEIATFKSDMITIESLLLRILKAYSSSHDQIGPGIRPRCWLRVLKVDETSHMTRWNDPILPRFCCKQAMTRRL